MSARQPLPVRAPEADSATARRRDGGHTFSGLAARLGAGPAPGGPPTTSGRPISPSRCPAGPPSISPDDARPAGAQAWRALRDVMDPEFPISIVDLGLIYDVRASDGTVEVDLTFTATGCPCMEFIREDIRERLSREPDVTDVAIHEVWDPPWTPARISPEGRAVLRRHGVGA